MSEAKRKILLALFFGMTACLGVSAYVVSRLLETTSSHAAISSLICIVMMQLTALLTSSLMIELLTISTIFDNRRFIFEISNVRKQFSPDFARNIIVFMGAALTVISLPLDISIAFGLDFPNHR